MNTLTRPRRLVLAILLVAVVMLDVLLLDNDSLLVVFLVAFLSMVLVAGSFSPFAESQTFLVSILASQISIVAFLAYRGNYVLAVVVGVASLSTVQLLWKSGSEEH